MSKQALILLVALVAGCDTNLALTSQAMVFRDTAEKCLLDVRDRAAKFETSSNCSSLKSASKRYIDAGGQSKDEPSEAALIAEQGRAMAWNARAISLASDSTLTLW